MSEFVCAKIQGLFFFLFFCTEESTRTFWYQKMRIVLFFFKMIIYLIYFPAPPSKMKLCSSCTIFGTFSKYWYLWAGLAVLFVSDRVAGSHDVTPICAEGKVNVVVFLFRKGASVTA